MNLSLSKGGLPASVKNRAWQYCQMAWRGVTSKKALSRLAALSPLLLLGVGQMANATDLLGLVVVIVFTTVGLTFIN
ncbi:hypothetical protein AIG89_23845 [Salmonella enterica subsp. enterica]|nr:hypothetical protein [Salmonella enterica subsp. enterica serovar Pomona]MII86701.1 hypothetical protein [Salmonella enterica subsp. enterica serovar Pomona]